MADYITEYITKKEYQCPCCGMLPPDFFVHDIKFPYSVLFDVFHCLRESFGRPIPISSGYRCPLHNQQIGGSLISVHMWGLALDADFDDADEVEEAYEYLDHNFGKLRIGKYVDTSTFIHMDLGYEIKPRASHHWVEGARF